MAIDFTLTPEQKELQASTRAFAQDVLAPIVREADAEPDPLKAFQLTKDAYVASTSSAIPSASPRARLGDGQLRHPAAQPHRYRGHGSAGGRRVRAQRP